MTFEEWWSAQSSDMKIDNAQYAAESAWDKQQAEIDRLKRLLDNEANEALKVRLSLYELREKYKQEEEE